MNDNIRALIRWVCDGDIKRSQQQARIILDGFSTKRDEQFRVNMLRKMDAKQTHLVDLPGNLKQFLIAEDSSYFPENKFILRKSQLPHG